jgi:hypothetical protein
MKNIACVFFILISVFAAAQNPSVGEIARTWKIKKGWFGEENIVMEMADTAKENGIVQLYFFSAQGTITTSIFSKKNYGMCGNGMLYFDAASWKLDFKDLVFDVKGGRFAESKFHYKMTYSISLLTKGMMVLRLVKTELKEEKNYH